MNAENDLLAGDFSSWLHQIRHALQFEDGIDVDCGECDACCSSSCFIHIRPEETRTLSRIPSDLPVPAPGLPSGHFVLGYDQDGRCPMITNGGCSIYDERPLTCINYDCRVFTAAGIFPGDRSKTRIAGQAKRWKFSYPTEDDGHEHLAVQAAAIFILEHA